MSSILSLAQQQLNAPVVTSREPHKNGCKPRHHNKNVVDGEISLKDYITFYHPKIVSASYKATSSTLRNDDDRSCYGVSSSIKDDWRTRANNKPLLITRNAKCH